MHTHDHVSIEENIPSHIFRYVERELYDYPVNKATCAEYWQQREDVLLRARQVPDPDTQNPNAPPADETAVKTVRLLVLEQRAERAGFYVRAIDSVLDTLTQEERTLVQRKYFDADTTNELLAMEMHMGRSRFYEMRHEIVRKFAMRFGLV